MEKAGSSDGLGGPPVLSLSDIGAVPQPQVSAGLILSDIGAVPQPQVSTGLRLSDTGTIPKVSAGLRLTDTGTIPKVSADLSLFNNEPEKHSLQRNTRIGFVDHFSGPIHKHQPSQTKKAVTFLNYQRKDTSTESCDFEHLRDTCNHIKETVRNLVKYSHDESATVQKEVEILTRDLLQVLMPGHIIKPNLKNLSYDSLRHDQSTRKTCLFPSDDESSLSEMSSEGTQASALPRKHVQQKIPVHKTKDTGSGQTTVDDLVSALARLDNRSVPRPEVFDLDSGRPFDLFLKDFESYCSGTFRGDQSRWSVELGQFLTGKIKSAFDAFYFPGEPYGRLKKKLLQWVKDSMESLRKRNKRKFEKMKYAPGESLRLFAARLERSFSLAFPLKRSESSSTLQRKFLEAVPKSFKKQVSSSATILRLQNQKLDWNGVPAMASAYDAEQAETDISVDRDAEAAEVWATTSAPLVFNARERGRLASPIASAGVSRRGESRKNGIDSNQMYRPRSVSAHAFVNNGRNVFDARSCFYCKRKGHIKSECWRRSGRCLLCGSTTHRIAQCDRRRELQDHSGTFQRGSRSRRNTGQFSRGSTFRQEGNPFGEEVQGEQSYLRGHRRVTFADQGGHQGNFFAPQD